MTVADYWASKIRELIAEAHTSGVKIEGSVFCDEYDHEVTLTITAGLNVAEVSLNND